MAGAVTLWEFLHHILTETKYPDVIDWIDSQLGEFLIKDAATLSQLWGEVKNRPTMNYAKLSRSLRYYYDKGIMMKIAGIRYGYRFLNKYSTCAVGVRHNFQKFQESPARMQSYIQNGNLYANNHMDYTCHEKMIFSSQNKICSFCMANAECVRAGFIDDTYRNFCKEQHNKSLVKSCRLHNKYFENQLADGSNTPNVLQYLTLKRENNLIPICGKISAKDVTQAEYLNHFGKWWCNNPYVEQKNLLYSEVEAPIKKTCQQEVLYCGKPTTNSKCGPSSDSVNWREVSPKRAWLKKAHDLSKPPPLIPLDQLQF